MNPKMKPAWKKSVWEQTPQERVIEGTRRIALREGLKGLPPLVDNEQNLDIIDEAVAKRFDGNWTPDTVRYAVRYEKDRFQWAWVEPVAPPQPAKPAYDEGQLESWQLPLDASEYVMRHANQAQMKDLVARLRKFESWKAEHPNA
jgi:hypothetical protein